MGRKGRRWTFERNMSRSYGKERMPSGQWKPRCTMYACMHYIWKASCGLHLSPSCDPSPSLDTEDPCFTSCLMSSGTTSSLRCTVNDDLPFVPKPNLRFRPVESHCIYISTFHHPSTFLSHLIFKGNAIYMDQKFQKIVKIV